MECCLMRNIRTHLIVAAVVLVIAVAAVVWFTGAGGLLSPSAARLTFDGPSSGTSRQMT